jgi:excisionase family DNA binding protein
MVSISKKASLANKSKSSKKHKPPKKSLIETHVMTLAETAKYLKVSKKLLAEQVVLGNIPGRTIGNQWRFSKVALDLWLAQPSLNHQDALVENKAAFLALAGAFADDATLPKLVESIYAARRQLTLEN